MSDLPEMELEDALDHLESWTESLQIMVADTVPQIRKALDREQPLMENAPSTGSEAELALRGVREKLDEVQAAVEIVERAIWANSKDRE